MRIRGGGLVCGTVAAIRTIRRDQVLMLPRGRARLHGHVEAERQRRLAAGRRRSSVTQLTITRGQVLQCCSQLDQKAVAASCCRCVHLAVTRKPSGATPRRARLEKDVGNSARKPLEQLVESVTWRAHTCVLRGCSGQADPVQSGCGNIDELDPSWYASPAQLRRSRLEPQRAQS